MGKKNVSQGKKKVDETVMGQIKQFTTDSQRFINKCDKPDRKGRNSFALTLPRIYENSPSLHYWILSDGIHRIFRQTHLHPN